MRGVIIKAIAGFYYVWSDNKIYECKARGRFRKNKITPLVGDDVEFILDSFSVASDESFLPGAIEDILPRRNEFDRPPIANVDVCIIAESFKDPLPLSYITDRMLISAEMKNCEIVICLNKSDLTQDRDFAEIYEGIYPVFCVSAKSGEGIEALRKHIAGKKAALCGPSGIGKSSLTNALVGNAFSSAVGEISEKTLRGKNTTRHSELFVCSDFFLFDTPGFTSFEAPELNEDELDRYFPEFSSYLGRCRFDNCAHMKEPDCAVKAAAANGKIDYRRYESYITIYKEIKERRKY